MQCPNCGNELNKESKFCKYCGNPVIQDKVKKQDINNRDILSEEKCVKCGNEEFEKDQFQATGGNFSKVFRKKTYAKTIIY